MPAVSAHECLRESRQIEKAEMIPTILAGGLPRLLASTRLAFAALAIISSVPFPAACSWLADGSCFPPACARIVCIARLSCFQCCQRSSCAAARSRVPIGVRIRGRNVCLEGREARDESFTKHLCKIYKVHSTMFSCTAFCGYSRHESAIGIKKCSGGSCWELPSNVLA